MWSVPTAVVTVTIVVTMMVTMTMTMVIASVLEWWHVHQAIIHARSTGTGMHAHGSVITKISVVTMITGGMVGPVRP